MVTTKAHTSCAVDCVADPSAPIQPISVSRHGCHMDAFLKWLAGNFVNTAKPNQLFAEHLRL
jgi:hypothetical protein